MHGSDVACISASVCMTLQTSRSLRGTSPYPRVSVAKVPRACVVSSTSYIAEIGPLAVKLGSRQGSD